MKKFHSIEQLNEAVKNNNGQLNLDILLTQRANLGDGWEYFNIDDEVKREAIKYIVYNVLGGWGKYKDRLEYVLNNTPISHWGLQRVIFNGKRWSYCPGQCQITELRHLREFIKK